MTRFQVECTLGPVTQHVGPEVLLVRTSYKTEIDAATVFEVVAKIQLITAALGSTVERLYVVALHASEPAPLPGVVEDNGAWRSIE